MKKKALSAALILALIILFISAVTTVNAAPTYTIPTGPLTPPTISLASPTDTTYVSWFIPLEFSVSASWDGYVDHVRIEYSLDSGSRIPIYNLFRTNALDKDFSFTLGPVYEGTHQLEIFATVGGVYHTTSNALSSGDFVSTASVFFSVNTTGQGQIKILSPKNQTYNINKGIPVDFTVNRTASIVDLGFTLDQQSNVTILTPKNTTLYGPIPDGVHTLKVYSVFSDILPVWSTVNFTVDTTPPEVTVESIQNNTSYNTSQIPLDFTVNETTQLITYILDGKVYTINGNKTLTILQDGEHTLTVYATDAAGNAGASQTLYFDVRVPIPPQTAYGVLPPMVVVLIGGLSILIYLEKNRQKAARSDSKSA